MTASAITPVTLLTGYLGSGKTTLLNRLLKHPAMEETAVLINEFGAVSIDHLLVREASENIMVMSNGCICCSVAGDMVQALRDLYFKRANSEVPPFKRVVIETTGLADPAPIMHTLIEMPLVAARYSLSGIVTTVDAEHGERQLDNHPESIKQAAVADRIIITKTDRVPAAVTESLMTRLRMLNPAATLLTAVSGEIDPAKLFDTGLYQPGKQVPDVAKWLVAEAYRPVATSPLGSPARVQASAPRHDDCINAFAITLDQPVVWQDLVDAMETLTTLRGDQLLRVKGIINAAGESRPRAVHAVQHTIYPVAVLPEWPDEDRRTRLVFITRDLDESFVRETLMSFLHKSPASPVSVEAAA
ncbi:MAG: GTP-binding protein [Betaproteobacteria bacterium]|nr:GTP-binding protein [Betaproteobacteria bacterium]